MKNKIRKTRKMAWDDRIFSILVTAIVFILTAACLIPFIYLLAVSLSGSTPVLRGEVFLLPRDFTLETYQSLIENGSLIRSMERTILLTIVYVGVSMVMTVLCAYPLSVPGLKGKKPLLVFIMFTMYFSGGMIPSYLVVNKLGLIDSYWSLILPCALSTYNMIVMRTAFAGIPESLRDAALIDGAGDLTILTRIVLPLSKPTLATIALFYAVGRWNGLQDGLLYINDPGKAILQLSLKQIVQSAQSFSNLMLEGAASADMLPSQTIRAGSLIFSMIPILIIYPFLQKYFVKGTMIGSVKG